MFRTSLIAARPVLRSAIASRAAFSTTACTMAEGDTGGIRSGGLAGGDAFTKREKASEDYAIRMREKEKVAELRQKVKEQREHLKKLEEHIDELSKEHGGEQK